MNKNTKNINSKQLISEMQEMLREPKMTMESMIFSDVDNSEYDEPEEMPDERAEEQPRMEEKPKSDNITQAINQIRQISLKAIAELADNPADERYILLKKVWNTVDKAFENQSKVDNSSAE